MLVTNHADSIVFIQGTAKFKNGNNDSWTATGFIVHDKGFILTNSHVLEDSDKYQPGSIEIKGVPRSKVLPQLPLEVIKRDTDLDLALLKLPNIGQPWKAVRIGDSDSVRVGHSLIVLGFPLKSDLSFAKGDIGNIHAPKGRFQTDGPVKSWQQRRPSL